MPCQKCDRKVGVDREGKPYRLCFGCGAARRAVAKKCAVCAKALSEQTETKGFTVCYGCRDAPTPCPTAGCQARSKAGRPCCVCWKKARRAEDITWMVETCVEQSARDRAEGVAPLDECVFGPLN